MPHVLPLVHPALADGGLQPEREARRVRPSPLAPAGTPAGAREGPARRRPRPTAPVQPQAHDRGQKPTPPATPLVLVHEPTGPVGSRGPTEPGTTHDQPAAAQAPSASPGHARLATETGWPGEAPAGILIAPPKKTARPGRERG